MADLVDSIGLETYDGTTGGTRVVLDGLFTSIELGADLVAPRYVTCEFGDESSWLAVREVLATGTRYQVSLNGAQWMRGRMLSKSTPRTADAGSTVRLTIQSVLADAWFASCDPRISLKGATLLEAILAAYAPFGIGEQDLITDAELAVDLLTGKGKGARLAPLTEIKADQAQVAPPETVYQFVERHLSRYSLSHWDSPDGRLVIGAPDDTRAPIYRLQSVRDPARSPANNLCGMERVEDYEQVPTLLGVYGNGGGGILARKRISALVEDPTLAAADPQLYRPVIVEDKGIKTQDQAAARARRELSMRSRAKDAWTAELDTLTYRDGNGGRVPFQVDTTADVQVDTADGAAQGIYLVHQVRHRLDAQQGPSTTLGLVGQGVWQL